MKVIKTIFRHYKYILLALAVMLVVFVSSIWFPNWRLINEVFSSEMSLFDKLSILIALLGSIKTNFTALSASYTIAISILFGIDISLLVFYVKSKHNLFIKSGVASGLGGFVSGIFGIGCAACGTFLLAPVLGLFGVGGILAFLPLGGEEFGILGVIFLIYSIYIITRKIQKPPVCEIV